MSFTGRNGVPRPRRRSWRVRRCAGTWRSPGVGQIRLDDGDSTVERLAEVPARVQPFTGRDRHCRGTDLGQLGEEHHRRRCRGGPAVAHLLRLLGKRVRLVQARQSAYACTPRRSSAAVPSPSSRAGQVGSSTWRASAVRSCFSLASSHRPAKWPRWATSLAHISSRSASASVSTYSTARQLGTGGRHARHRRRSWPLGTVFSLSWEAVSCPTLASITHPILPSTVVVH